MAFYGYNLSIVPVINDVVISEGSGKLTLVYAHTCVRLYGYGYGRPWFVFSAMRNTPISYVHIDEMDANSWHLYSLIMPT